MKPVKMAPEVLRGVGRGRGRHKPQPRDGGGGGGPQQFPPRKRSIPYGFDFDLDEVWAPLNPHLKHVTKGSPSKNSDSAKKSGSRGLTSSQSLRKCERKKQDSGEFDTEGEIFKEKESLLKDIAGLAGGLGEMRLEETVMRDAYGRQVVRRDSGDSSPIINSQSSSPFATMSSVQFSGLSSASSRNSSSTSDPLPVASRHRSQSNSERASRTMVRGRQLSAGSLASRSPGSRHSPGGVRKVGNSAAILTPGLGLEKRGSRHGSRGQSPLRN